MVKPKSDMKYEFSMCVILYLQHMHACFKYYLQKLLPQGSPSCKCPEVAKLTRQFFNVLSVEEIQSKTTFGSESSGYTHTHAVIILDLS